MDPNAAFIELAKLRLGEEDVGSALQRVAELAKAVLPGASDVSVTIFERGRQRARTIAFTGPLSLALDEAQYAARVRPST